MTVYRVHGLKRGARIAVPIATFATVALVAAACGSSSSSSTTPAAAGSSTAPSTAPSAAPSSAAGSSATGGVTVEAHKGSLGTYLTDASGKSLYLFASDTSTMSTCSGACATAWPPLTTTSAATAGSGVTATDLGTLSRSGGTKQVTFNGHPLYYFEGDTAAGQTNGQGSSAFGAKWWLVTPAGQALEAAAPAASQAPAGGGYGY
jgi:predicted lipoprotein with Yx(FWY)xxD motif